MGQKLTRTEPDAEEFSFIPVWLFLGYKVDKPAANTKFLFKVFCPPNVGQL